MGLMPSLLASSRTAQVFVTFLCLIVYFAVVVFAFPWRQKAINIVDMVVCAGLITLVLIGCLSTEEKILADVGILGVIVVVLCLILVCFILVRGTFSYKMPKDFHRIVADYDIFLSYDEVTGRFPALYLKWILENSYKLNVYLADTGDDAINIYQCAYKSRATIVLCDSNENKNDSLLGFAKISQVAIGSSFGIPTLVVRQGKKRIRVR